MEEDKRLQMAVTAINEKLMHVKSGIMELRRMKSDVSVKTTASSLLVSDKEIDKKVIILYILSGFLIVTGFIMSLLMGITMNMEKKNLYTMYENREISFAEYDELLLSLKSSYTFGIIFGIIIAVMGLSVLLFRFLKIHKLKRENKILSRGTLDTKRNDEMKRLSGELYQTLMDVDARILNLRGKFTGDLSIFAELENDSKDLKRALNIVMNKK